MASLSDSLVRKLLEGRYIAAFASHNSNGSIHVVAVWYLFDGAALYVATSNRSRKARNAQSNAQVSLMIDSRDVAASCGVNVFGTAEILRGDLSKQWVERIHRKYLSDAAIKDPNVGPVFAAVDDVVIKITRASIISWDMRAIDQQYFGGSIEKNPGYLLPLAR
jgi:general stress protein 26